MHANTYTIQSSADIKRQLAEQDIADARAVDSLLARMDIHREADYSDLEREFHLGETFEVNG